MPTNVAAPPATDSRGSTWLGTRFQTVEAGLTPCTTLTCPRPETGTEAIAWLAGDEQRARASVLTCLELCDWFCAWAASGSVVCVSNEAAETGQDVGQESAFARLAAEPERLERLGQSVVAVDEHVFGAEVEGLGLQRVLPAALSLGLRLDP